ncbi:type II secretion system protein GspM [Bradyrhizobium sp. SYSU BS000235]|uniref:type II secretion system protein GspM n=1 Tax=Bradyrhizobium sp. SYSU BS000235 TaxID=3411332 RepID=UPI003C762A15
MTAIATLRKTFSGSPSLAASAYAALVLALLFIVVTSVTDLLSRRAEVASAETMLAQLDGRRLAAARTSSGDVSIPTGSPFLEGATFTIAGATLLQRVDGAVTKLGGNVLSSQVDLKGSQSKAGFISMIASCEIGQAELQKLLYDLEAGMPFLFVDQLVVESTTSSTSGEDKLRILLAVSGQWRGSK